MIKKHIWKRKTHRGNSVSSKEESRRDNNKHSSQQPYGSEKLCKRSPRQPLVSLPMLFIRK